MRSQSFDPWRLAMRIRNGDAEASREFLEEIQRQIGRLIRQRIRRGRAASEVDRRIAAAMGQLFDEDPRRLPRDDEGLLKEATGRISQAALEAILGDRCARETVCDI